MVTVKQLKAKLKKLGVAAETYKGLRKNELESLVEQNEGGGNGGGAAAASRTPQSPAATVTEAAAAAGVGSPSSLLLSASPKKKQASPKQAKAFLAAAGGGFGKSPSPKTLKVKKKAASVLVSPTKGNKTKKVKKADISAMKMCSPRHGTFKAVASKWAAPKPWAGFKTRARSPPPSPKEQQITYKNGHTVPVMIAQSALTPGWNPRKAAVNAIPGHNHPLDPGASISFSVRKGNTLYVYDGHFNPVETLCTKAHPRYGPEVETRYVPTQVGAKSNFTKGAITKVAGGGGGGWAPQRKKAPKSAMKKGGRRRRTRRRRRRRRRRTRR